MKIFILILILFSSTVFAHKSSDSYLHIEGQDKQTRVMWEIAIRDLENVLTVDLNDDGEITWAEIRGLEESLYDYVTDRFSMVSNGKNCKLSSSPVQINYHSDGAYLVMHLQTPCELSKATQLNYQLFFDVDTQHRGLLNLTNNNVQTSHVFSPEETVFEYIEEKNSHWDSFGSYVWQGVWHIWIGYDHILFLVSLLLPAVLIWREKSWQARDSGKESLIDVVKIVTAFTVAHSLTLCMVILADVSLPVAIVESAIALSVVIVALNNLRPVLRVNRWQMGFGFGLIHGFGFANVLLELQLTNQALISSLIGFNLGVELGQLAIVFAFLPIAYMIRNYWVYQKVVLKLGSVAIASLGIVWLVERSI